MSASDTTELPPQVAAWVAAREDYNAAGAACGMAQVSMANARTPAELTEAETLMWSAVDLLKATTDALQKATVALAEWQRRAIRSARFQRSIVLPPPIDKVGA